MLYRRKDGNYGLIETGPRNGRRRESGRPLIDVDSARHEESSTSFARLHHRRTAGDDEAGACWRAVGRTWPSVVPGVEAEALRKVLEEREQLASTAIGDGIAIPHGKLDSVGQLVGALGRAVEGIEFESIDGKPTHLFFMLVAPGQLDRRAPQGAGAPVAAVQGRRLPPAPARRADRARRCTRSSPKRTPSTRVRVSVAPRAVPRYHGREHDADAHGPVAARRERRAAPGAAGRRAGARPAHHDPAHPEAGPGAGRLRPAGPPRAGAGAGRDRDRVPRDAVARTRRARSVEAFFALEPRLRRRAPRACEVPALLREAADRLGVPLLRTPLVSSVAIDQIQKYLELQLAPDREHPRAC